MELSQRSGKVPNLPWSILAPGRHMMMNGWKLLASLTSLACFIMLSASNLGVSILILLMLLFAFLFIQV